MEKTEKEKTIKRLRRIEGQVRGIQTMIENDRECPDILIEISAIKSALDAVSKIIAQNYTYECVKVSPDNEEKLESLLKAIFKYH
ncbi:metal-sensitive transcriptional regulator [Athalassotoga saccharophila]|uniref:metal-sensitive transcriptional regulator n=1 Tax=Athalassotoga saccharophila TaxID=1441386 RepID=UPI0018D99E5A|nr:metal-sensitive transcriptional regulator [Athalassotoga saccharophila]BBJ27884.1 copper-sensing transcriptional repressor CsoR [Athalassotoga saccharophila]